MNPDFIVVGVARSGTTSLFYYLSQHPEIEMTKIKEPKYFSSIDLDLPQNGIGDKTVFSKMITDEKKYDALFNNLDKNKIIGECSSDYFYYHKSVIPRIKQKFGDIKIIICLRNPIDRAYSAYNNLVRDSREFLSFPDGLDAENKRIENNWDWMWHYKNGSLYSQALSQFQNEFSKVKVVFFDDFKFKTENVMSELFLFLGVNSQIKIDFKTRYSISGKPKSKIISILTSRKNPLIFILREIILKLIPRHYLELISSKLYKKEKIDMKTYVRLKSYFYDDIKKLEILTNRDLTSWL